MVAFLFGVGGGRKAGDSGRGTDRGRVLGGKDGEGEWNRGIFGPFVEAVPDEPAHHLRGKAAGGEFGLGQERSRPHDRRGFEGGRRGALRAFRA